MKKKQTRKPARPAAAGRTPQANFRLKPETLADLDLIAAHHARETATEFSRSDAVRLAARKEADRIRAMQA